MPAERRFQPAKTLGVLLEHQVDFVVIGGFGAFLQGSPLPTVDIDITPDGRKENLDRLAAALRRIDARVYAADVPDGLAFDCSGEALSRASIWNLVTRYGPLDISLEPAGTSGYADLRRSAVVVHLDDLEVPVASVADIVRSKEAAGRDKDRRALPVLRKLLERLDDNPDDGSDSGSSL